MSQLTVARPAPLPSGTSRTRPRRDLRVVDATGAADGGWFRWLCGGLLVAGLLAGWIDAVVGGAGAGRVVIHHGGKPVQLLGAVAGRAHLDVGLDARRLDGAARRRDP